jgi:hypothetical protein
MDDGMISDKPQVPYMSVSKELVKQLSKPSIAIKDGNKMRILLAQREDPGIWTQEADPFTASRWCLSVHPTPLTPISNH